MEMDIFSKWNTATAGVFQTFEPPLTLDARNRSTECPNDDKSLKNELPMGKHIGAVLRKSFQLAIVAEIGPLENFGPLQKKVQ